jgi:hypothetical protein
MIRRTDSFVKAFSDIADQFIWYLEATEYGSIKAQCIRGIKEKSEDDRVYTPITAYVERRMGKYLEPAWFHKAGELAWISADCVNQIVDAADDWPDRSSGYKVKPYETKTRQQLVQVCQLSKHPVASS